VCLRLLSLLFLFFFHITATTDIYTLSLHDALPIFQVFHGATLQNGALAGGTPAPAIQVSDISGYFWFFSSSNVELTVKLLDARRSEEHTSELQSRENLVCRLLLEKKKKKKQTKHQT